MNKSDLLIVGGGLVGAALALALREQKCAIRLLEGRVPDFEEAGWDARVYAISPASRDLLSRSGAWARLPKDRVQAVSAMRVAGDLPGYELRLDALEAGCDELAWIVESRVLQKAIWDELTLLPNVEIITPAETVSFDPVARSVTLADGQVLSARLIVGADGAHSWIRSQAGIAPKVLPYDQYGVVANFLCEKAHLGTASQWFREDGILAWLPLPGQCMSMVWSCSEALQQELLALPAPDLARRVRAAGDARLGDLQLLTPACAFPLRLNLVPEWSRSGLVLIGDAAHTIHPLAGQGVNLGFGDVGELAVTLAATSLSRWGDLSVLRAYERARREPVYRLQGTCHALQRLFGNTHPLLRTIRNWGLGLTDQSTWLKRQLIRQAIS